MFALPAQFLATDDFRAIQPAFAKKDKDKEKDKDKNKDKDKDKVKKKDKDEDDGDGNDQDKDDESGLGLANGLTDGNGVAIGLGNGVGVGVGVGNGDTIAVGVGVSVGDRGAGHGNHSLEREPDHKDRRQWRDTDGGGWSPGKGLDKGQKSGADDLNLGEKFDVGRIRIGPGNNLDELGKLLNPAGADGLDHGSGNGHAGEAAAGNADHGRAAPNGKAEPLAESAKVMDNATGNGNAFVKTEEQASRKAIVESNGTDKSTAKEAAAEARVEAKEAKTEAKAEAKAEKAEAKAEAKAAKAEAKAARKAAREEDKAVQPAPAGKERSQAGIAPIASGSYVEREVLALNLSPSGISRIRQLGFGMSDSSLEQDSQTLVTLYAPARLDALSAIALLRRELPRESFHLNRVYRPYNTAISDDADQINPQNPDPGTTGRCRGDKCYARDAIGWKDKFADCARNINVGIIDTDVDLRHPTFLGQKITSRTFLAEGKQPSATAHGTGVLALLAGRPDSDTPGLIPEAKFFMAQVFFTDGNGETITDTVSVLKSLEWMKASQARVVNMSFTGPQDELIQARLKAMRSQGYVFTAAAGNDGPAALPAYPAAYPEVIAVTAVTKDKRVYPSANRGPYIDLAAPGVRIWTALPEVLGGLSDGHFLCHTVCDRGVGASAARRDV